MTATEQNDVVALIGATGGMGSFVLAELTNRHRHVRAVVRRPDAVPATEFVEPVVADVFDPTALTEALRGIPTAVSAFNPGWTAPDLYERYLLGSRTIQQAAIAAGVERLIVLGGASSLLDGEGRRMLDAGLPPEPYGSGVRATSDYLDEIRHEARLDWVFLSPPADCGPMGPTGRTGHYRLGTDHPVLDDEGRNALSREDLAVAVADEVERPQHHRTRFTVGR